jgi:hypothetical protein
MARFFCPQIAQITQKSEEKRNATPGAERNISSPRPERFSWFGECGLVALPISNESFRLGERIHPHISQREICGLRLAPP